MKDQQDSRFSVHRFYVLMYILAGAMLASVVYNRIQVVHEHVVPRIIKTGCITALVVFAVIAFAHVIAVSLIHPKEVKE